MIRRFDLCSASRAALIFSLLLAGCAESRRSDSEGSHLSVATGPRLGTAKQALEVELPTVFTPKTAAALTGRSAGVAVDVGPLLAEPIYAQTIVEQFSDITPENATKWGNLQPVAANSWDFSA